MFSSNSLKSLVTACCLSVALASCAAGGGYGGGSYGGSQGGGYGGGSQGGGYGGGSQGGGYGGGSQGGGYGGGYPENQEPGFGTGTGATVGTVVGGAAGGAIGRQLSKDNKTLGTVVGAAVGAAIGNVIGGYFDNRDLASRDQAFYGAMQAPQGQPPRRWENAPTGNYGSITPYDTYRDPRTGQLCRDYEESYNRGGQTYRQVSRACQQRDGSWQVVSR
jgi:surface antigen